MVDNIVIAIGHNDIGVIVTNVINSTIIVMHYSLRVIVAKVTNPTMTIGIWVDLTLQWGGVVINMATRDQRVIVTKVIDPTITLKKQVIITAVTNRWGRATYLPVIVTMATNQTTVIGSNRIFLMMVVGGSMLISGINWAGKIDMVIPPVIKNLAYQFIVLAKV